MRLEEKRRDEKKIMKEKKERMKKGGMEGTREEKREKRSGEKKGRRERWEKRRGREHRARRGGLQPWATGKERGAGEEREEEGEAVDKQHTSGGPGSGLTGHAKRSMETT